METSLSVLEKKQLIEQDTYEKFISIGLSQQDIDHIAETTSSLDYMYIASTERAKTASKNPAYLLDDGKIILPFWLDPNMRPGGGACYDASENLRFSWFFDGTFDRLHNKGLDLFVCGGSDDKVFVGEGFNHVFLVISKHSTGSKKIDPDNAVIVDPSLQKISSFNKSGYKVRRVFDEDTVFTNPLNHEIVPYDIENLKKPNYIITSESTAVMGMDPKRKYVIYMLMLHDKEKNSYYPSIGVSDGNRSAIYYKPEDSTFLKSFGSLVDNFDDFETSELVRGMASEISKIRIQNAPKKDGYEVDNTGMRLVGLPFTRKI